MHRFIGALATVIILLQSAALQPAVADTFVLQSGGRIEGDLMNADQNPRTSYVIALHGGSQITLDASMVEKVLTAPPELAEYEKMRRQAPDTVDGQMKLAEWCKEHNLAAQRKTHLERVLALDPNQADARRMLGYRRYKDQWMTYDEEQLSRGLVKHMVNGEMRWITPEEAENLDNSERLRHLQAEWRRKISTWRHWLDGKNAEQGRNGLLSIRDPSAISPLGERLNGSRSKTVAKDTRADARLIYVDVLGRFNSPDARGQLAIAAIDDPEKEVRLSCLDVLEKQKDEAVTKFFIARMSDKHASDETIDRAGVALGRLKDPTSVAALVKFVSYERTEVVPTTAGGPGAMTTTFNKNGRGGGGLAMNQQPQSITHLIRNSGVLEALEAITGENFGFDSVAWQKWYRNQVASGGPIVKQP